MSVALRRKSASLSEEQFRGVDAAVASASPSGLSLALSSPLCLVFLAHASGFLVCAGPVPFSLKAGGGPLKHSLAVSFFQSFWFSSSCRRCFRWGSFGGLLFTVVGMLYFDALRLVWSFGDQRCLPLHAQVFIPLFVG
eukprot:Gb_10905 [translate_table: standard]